MRACERDTRESGYLYFPWNVAGRGLVQICSGSLMERAKAYHLPVELARGTFISREHETTGTARILRLADGQQILRLEGFETSNGRRVPITFGASGGRRYVSPRAKAMAIAMPAAAEMKLCQASPAIWVR